MHGRLERHLRLIFHGHFFKLPAIAATLLHILLYAHFRSLDLGDVTSMGLGVYGKVSRNPQSSALKFIHISQTHNHTKKHTHTHSTHSHMSLIKGMATSMKPFFPLPIESQLHVLINSSPCWCHFFHLHNFPLPIYFLSVLSR